MNIGNMSQPEHNPSHNGPAEGSQARASEGEFADDGFGGRPPEMRSRRARLITRAMHGWFALTRAMTLGVRAACFDSGGQVFLVRHSYVPGWHLPGGGVERGQTAEEALRRELAEEGNLELDGAPALFAVYFNPRTSRRDHVVFYRCQVRQTAKKLPDREIIEAGFFPLDGLPPGTTAATRRRLSEVAGERQPDPIW